MSLLSWLIFLPVIGMIAIMSTPKDQAQLIRKIAAHFQAQGPPEVQNVISGTELVGDVVCVESGTVEYDLKQLNGTVLVQVYVFAV